MRNFHFIFPLFLTTDEVLMERWRLLLLMIAKKYRIYVSEWDTNSICNFCMGKRSFISVSPCRRWQIVVWIVFLVTFASFLYNLSIAQCGTRQKVHSSSLKHYNWSDRSPAEVNWLLILQLKLRRKVFDF